MLPFWTNLLIRTYALMAVLRTEGYVNTALEWSVERGELDQDACRLRAGRRFDAAAAALQ